MGVFIPAGYDLALRKFLTFIYLSGCAIVAGPLVRYSEERATAIKQLFETMAWLPSCSANLPSLRLWPSCHPGDFRRPLQLLRSWRAAVKRRTPPSPAPNGLSHSMAPTTAVSPTGLLSLFTPASTPESKLRLSVRKACVLARGVPRLRASWSWRSAVRPRTRPPSGSAREDGPSHPMVLTNCKI